jgi:uncharacterized protein YndB with AHSA1/START domain
MKTNVQTVKSTQTIQTPPEEVFDALQYECRLGEWLCLKARTEPRKGGKFELHWRTFDARGVFTAFAPPKRLAFTWQGSSDPGETNVKITLKAVEGGTRLTLTHSGWGSGKKWAGFAQNAEREWAKVLGNLKSVLETGIDLRETNRPRIGIGFETAADRPGVHLTEIVPGSPAEAAGLQKGDVLVSMDGRKLRSQEEFIQVFGSFRGGQKVKVVLLREGKRHMIAVALGTRPVLQVPQDPAVVAEQARQAHEQAMAALRTSVAVLTDEQAAQPPAEGEWSVKQVLVHLCVCESEYRSWAARVLMGDKPDQGFEAQLPNQFAAVLTTTPTVRGLLDRLERELAESRIFIGALSPELRANRLRYRRAALALLEYCGHVDMHLEQVRKTVNAITH